MKPENKTVKIKLLKSNVNSGVFFNKEELGVILKLYGRMVAIGEWRDYGISMFKDFSIFSIYKHATEFPVYMVKKKSSKFNDYNIFSVVAVDGKILKRGNDLSSVLKPLEAKLFRIVD